MSSHENNSTPENTSSEIPDGVSAGPSAEVTPAARLQMQVPQMDAARGGLLGAANQPIFPASAAHVVSIQHVQQWQSPFPPPKDVKEYEAVLPGAFDRMVTMVEQSQGAQIESERAGQESLRAYSMQGTLLGGLITLGAMACSLVCIFRGASWVAGAFLSVPVMSVAKALIESARSRANSSTATESGS
jgi:uncharacterized membrane protein